MKGILLLMLLCCCTTFCLGQDSARAFRSDSVETAVLSATDSLKIDSLLRLVSLKEASREKDWIKNQKRISSIPRINNPPIFFPGGKPSPSWKDEVLNREKYSTVTVNYATDRNLLTDANGRQSFGSDRADMQYGTCLITIPLVHKIGVTESPGFASLTGYNDAEHIVLKQILPSGKTSFFTGLTTRIQASKGKSAFIFIHGYNVSFEDAAKRTAQIQYDLRFDGIPILYSWPSQDSFYKYSTDESNIEWTQSHLVTFLTEFINKTQVQNVYIIAHSMGNRAMSRALAAVAIKIPDLKDKIKEVILAAPDVDADIFRNDIAPDLKRACKRVTVYGASTDVAITLSKYFHTYRRLGDSFQAASSVPGIDFIDATGVDSSIMGHSYLATNRTVLTDVADIINNHLPVGRRFQIQPIPPAGQPKYYKFKK